MVEHFLGKEEAIGSIPIMGLKSNDPVSVKIKVIFSAGLFGLFDREYVFLVNIMRDIVHLACGDCKRRNYSTTRNKKQSTERYEFSKYCRFCRKHTPHKEIK